MLLRLIPAILLAAVCLSGCARKESSNDLVLTAGTGESAKVFRIRWFPSNGAEGYVLHINRKGETAPESIRVASAEACSPLNVTGVRNHICRYDLRLNPGESAAVRVAAFNQFGESPSSKVELEN